MPSAESIESGNRAQLVRAAAWTATCAVLVLALMPHPPSFGGHFGDKFQHLAAFFMLALLVTAAWPALRAIEVFALLAAFGGAIELAQLIPLFHRDADVLDWAADLAAILAGLGLRRVVRGFK